MTPIAQMDRQKCPYPTPAKTSPCRCVVSPIHAPDYLRYLRHLRIQLPFPGSVQLPRVRPLDLPDQKVSKSLKVGQVMRVGCGLVRKTTFQVPQRIPMDEIQRNLPFPIPGKNLLDS